MDHILSRRDQAIGQDYLSKFQLASSSLLSTQNPMEQVFPPYGQPTTISSTSPLEFRPPQPSYTNSAGIQYSLTQNYDIGLTDRYLQPGFSHPFLTEDFYPSLCPPPPAHLSTQQYAISIADSTPSMLPPQQSSQLSPMLRSQRQSPQQLPAPPIVHNKLTSIQRAPSHSPSMYSSQRQSPQHSPISIQQHFNSPASASSFSYPSSQCSQRNDPPLGNMHMTKVSNNSFNTIPQFSPQTFLTPSQHSNMRVSNSKAVPKEDDPRGHFLNHLSSSQRGIQRESMMNTGTQNHPKSSIYPTSSASSQQTLTPNNSKPQSRYQIGATVPAAAHRSSLPANRPYLPQNSNLSKSSSVNRTPTLSQISSSHHPTISRASNNLPPPFDAIDSLYPYISQNQKTSRENPVYLTPPITNMVNSSNPLLSSFEKRNAASLSAANDAMATNNPYSLYSVFSLDQSNSGLKGSRGRGVSTRARGRGGRPHSLKMGTHEETNPLLWYKCSDSLSTSSFQSDVEAMQADTAMESSMLRKMPPTDLPSHQSANEAHGSKSGSNSSQLNSNQLTPKPTSTSATKAAALASIQLKQEIVDNLSKCKPQKLNSSVSSSAHEKNHLPNGSSQPGVIMQPSSVQGSSVSNSGFLASKQPVSVEKEKGILSSNNLTTCQKVQPPVTSQQAHFMNNNNEHDKSTVGMQKMADVINVSKPPAKKLQNLEACPTEKKSFSARERVFDMWRAGQVVGRVPGKGKTKASTVNLRSNENSLSAAKPTVVTNSSSHQNSDSKLVALKKKENKETSAPKVTSELVTSNKRISHFEERKKSNSSNSIIQVKQDLHYVMFHGHKLICLKSLNEAALLLCQFQFECFPDKGFGAINNCIDRALRIKKRVLDHPQKDKITAFLEKNGYSVLNSVLTINLNDAKRVYHHMYKLTSCSPATCVVGLSHQAVDLDTVSMPLMKRTQPLEMFMRVKKEKKSTEDNNYGRVSSKTDHHWQSGVEDVTKDHAVTHKVTHSLRPHKNKDNQSLGSDHTELYGKEKELDDNADLIIVEALEDPYIIKRVPDAPMIGGLCNTIQGQVRSYLHENENYLVVEDLCRIFNDTDFYERLEKDNYILYSCTAEIGEFLNGLNTKFPRLCTLQQSLIKGTDIGAHITEEDYVTSNVAPVVGNGTLKRSLCKQEILDDYCSSPKQRKCDFAPSNEEQKMFSPESNSLSDDSDSQENNNATVIFNVDERIEKNDVGVDDMSLDNSSTHTVPLTLGLLNDFKMRSESSTMEGSGLNNSKVVCHEASCAKDIFPVTMGEDAIISPSISNSDIPKLNLKDPENVSPSRSGTCFHSSEEPIKMSDNLSDTTPTAQSCDAESDQEKRLVTETTSCQSEIDIREEYANIKDKTELFNTDKSTHKDVSDEPGSICTSKNFNLRDHGLKLRNMLLETKRNTDLSNSSAHLSSDTKSRTNSIDEAYGEMNAILPLQSVLNDSSQILQQEDLISHEESQVLSETSISDSEKRSCSPEVLNDFDPSFIPVSECTVDSANDKLSAIVVENNIQAPGQDIAVNTDNNNTIEHMSEIVPEAAINKDVMENSTSASDLDSDKIETANAPTVIASKQPSEFSDLTLVDGFRVKVISKSETTDSGYDGSLGSHAELIAKKKHPESIMTFSGPSASSSAFCQPPVLKINLSHTKTLDDIEIMNSTSSGSLAAPPVNPFMSRKAISEGYSKLCRQNKALLDIVHILRKELVAAKDGKEKAERVSKYYEGVIHDITSTYKSGDEETPISIPDDD